MVQYVSKIKRGFAPLLASAFLTSTAWSSVISIDASLTQVRSEVWVRGSHIINEIDSVLGLGSAQVDQGAFDGESGSLFSTNLVLQTSYHALVGYDEIRLAFGGEHIMDAETEHESAVEWLLSVDFTISQPVHFAGSNAAGYTRTVSGDIATLDNEFAITNLSESTTFASASNFWTAGSFCSSNLLPGSYRLKYRVFGTTSNASSFHGEIAPHGMSTLKFTPVPEPFSLSALAIGIAAMATRRKSRR